MADTPSVSLSRQELQERLAQIHRGDTLHGVSAVWGADPYDRKSGRGKTRYLWLIQVVDAGPQDGPKQIYMGEFENRRLVFGAILPNG